MASTTTITGEETEASPPPARTNAASHRLLYRGSLALPDSEVVLEGIAFVMEIAYKSPISLISSPIPLGLESMRGRPLRLVSTIPIGGIHVECFGDVSMYIHPEAFLTRSFFERTFCTLQYPLIPVSATQQNEMRTSIAVRIGFGDGQGPEESDILVFGQVDSPTSAFQSTSDSVPHMKLLAGRIAPPVVPQTPPRAPRPDDPLPRSHPLENLHLSPGLRGLKRKRSLLNPLPERLSTNPRSTPPAVSSPGLDLKKRSPGSALMAAIAEAQAQSEQKRKAGKVAPDGEGVVERKGPSRRAILIRAPSSSKLEKGQAVDKDGFLVPDLPSRKGKEKEADPSSIQDSGRLRSGSDESELETKNKTAIKKRTLSALEACGISKSHPEFKDMYGWIHRGVGFSVRKIIKDSKVDRDLITKLVESHLEMYFGGKGGKLGIQNDVGGGSSIRMVDEGQGARLGDTDDTPSISIRPRDLSSAEDQFSLPPDGAESKG